MARLELAKPGLKNLSRDPFAFIPIVQSSPLAGPLRAATNRCGRGESNSYDSGFKSEMSACCITPANPKSIT